MPELSTKERALKEAMSLLQTKGYNAFSFQHIADALGIKKPSLYDHFESKEELGLQLIQSYQARLDSWIETISMVEPAERIAAYFEVFSKFNCDGKKLCPLGSLSSDFNSLPKRMQKEITKAFAKQEKWLESVIVEGQKKKAFRTDLSAETLAQLVHAAGLGVQKVARLSGDEGQIPAVKKTILKIIAKS